MAVLATMTYVGAYSMGVGPLTFVLLGELFPLDARERASSLVVVLNWAFAFLVTKTYFRYVPPALGWVGLGWLQKVWREDAWLGEGG